MIKNIILFDGVCSLCNLAVRFIIKIDKKNIFYFASLQSGFAKNKLSKYKLDYIPDSVVLIKNDTIYIKSDAAFEIIKDLTKPWKLLLIFSVLPKSLTDYFYDLIAEYRYKVFGKKDRCPLPDKSIAGRFIKDDEHLN